MSGLRPPRIALTKLRRMYIDAVSVRCSPSPRRQCRVYRYTSQESAKNVSRCRQGLKSADFYPVSASIKRELRAGTTDVCSSNLHSLDSAAAQSSSVYTPRCIRKTKDYPPPTRCGGAICCFRLLESSSSAFCAYNMVPA